MEYIRIDLVEEQPAGVQVPKVIIRTKKKTCKGALQSLRQSLHKALRSGAPQRELLANNRITSILISENPPQPSHPCSINELISPEPIQQTDFSRQLDYILYT